MICLLSNHIIDSYKYFLPKSILSFEGDTVFESISNEVCKKLKLKVIVFNGAPRCMNH